MKAVPVSAKRMARRSGGNFQPSLLRVAASSTLQFPLPLPVGGLAGVSLLGINRFLLLRGASAADCQILHRVHYFFFFFLGMPGITPKQL